MLLISQHLDPEYRLPNQISTVAEMVAAHRGTTVEHVLEISVANEKHLYQSQ
ncbi:hypothetical protein DPMN_116068 [Dreissena polymorpha]|uniref:Uncharacterized protein n=1 Tax=Dreissena polymorpha TaxID=45954 RepID=A0A9D4KMW3_DREPO|nr:hypothetical protein DPMN_116068 [Dreissena polymorpha]